MSLTVTSVLLILGSAAAFGYLSCNCYLLYLANRTYEKRRVHYATGAIAVAAGAFFFLLRDGLQIPHWLPVSLGLVGGAIGLGLGYGTLRKKAEPPLPQWQSKLPQRYGRLAVALIVGTAAGFAFSYLIGGLVGL